MSTHTHKKGSGSQGAPGMLHTLSNPSTSSNHPGGSSTANSTYECSLHGLVPPHLLPTLLTRLTHTCGKDRYTRFAEHDIAHFPMVLGARRTDDSQIRLVRPLKVSNDGIITTTRPVHDTLEWELRMFGHPERHEEEEEGMPEASKPPQPLVTQRQVVRVPMMGDPVAFMPSLGYTFAFEHIRRGHLFFYEESIRVTPTERYQVASAMDPDAKDPWLVEATSLPTTMAGTQDMTGRLIRLKEALRGMTDLRVVGHTHLQHLVSDDAMNG
ncbi:hypothetical protein BJ684DRAFT_19810 [Piptocephalis cylindrospora]|uniref:Mediator of RNA polymerase II transcription subunit 18 n=1 Tax=Piptocephalis cylindrospora TaxID=1907219 RepID=A0A4P9Y4M1_9FUNG|nr:hypothetical protein BJ684DRAFT_19810 [Piptocephalis cylindrospora]|eukprot:RKP13724.1 hypothetical protein BJ684DRAFT_19810 [Piptocephalis cylindrospora]